MSESISLLLLPSRFQILALVHWWRTGNDTVQCSPLLGRRQRSCWGGNRRCRSGRDWRRWYQTLRPGCMWPIPSDGSPLKQALSLRVSTFTSVFQPLHFFNICRQPMMLTEYAVLLWAFTLLVEPAIPWDSKTSRAPFCYELPTSRTILVRS